MGLPRFYHPTTLSPHLKLKLSESAARHAGLVLRLNSGEMISLFNGDGCEYHAEIREVSRKAVEVEILDKKNMDRESPLKIHLLQAIGKAEKMDWVIQKAVELGVTEITPVFTQHCAVKHADKNRDKKLAHWQGIIISACEQSGRNSIPALHKTVSLENLVIQHKDLSLIFHPEAKLKFSDLGKRHKNNGSQKINILIGPEGGFHADEITLAEKHGFESVQLGSRILRTETAALAAISALQAYWGDF